MKPTTQLLGPFTPEEWESISLCAGWMIQLSPEKTDDGFHRLIYARRAMEALKRVLGEGYHYRIKEAVNT